MISRRPRGPWSGLLVVALALPAPACSSIGGDTDVPVALEIITPAGPAGGSPLIEIGDTLTLRARALNQAGDSVDASIRWRTPDTASLWLDSLTGRTTGRAPGNARIQARTGSLISGFIVFSVVPFADTLTVVPPDSFRVAAPDSTAGPLVARLDTLAPDGPLAGRVIVYELVSIFGAAGDSAVLTGGGALRQAVTGAAGTPSSPVSVLLLAGRPRPDSVYVEVRASRPGGGAIPGSGQRFVIRYD